MGILPMNVHGRDARATAPAFTLTELMVSVAVLVIAMLAVSYIFSSVTRTSGITTANIELTDVIETMRQTMQADLNAIAPGLLIIDSPDPRAVDLNNEKPYVPDAVGEDFIDNDPNYAPRRDRLVLLTSTNPGTYASWWGGTSGEAIITYGHNGVWQSDLSNSAPIPLWQAVYFPTAMSRTLGRRVILLGVDDESGNGLAQYPLGPSEATFDRFHQGWDDAVGETLSALLIRLDGLTSAQIRGLWRRSAAFYSVSPASADPDYHGKHAFQFMPRVGHFIVEWTEGELAVGGGLLWFGLYRGRDINKDGTDDLIFADRRNTTWPPDPSAADYYPPEEAAAAPDHPGYRAIWRVDKGTWHLRPKALRITVRLYDSNKRLRDADERLGQERSFILEVP